MKQHAYIETFGCQMNQRDSEIMAQLLAADYGQATRLEDADLVVVNTCSIRAKAEQKAFSLLGTLRALKEKNPRLLVAVAGCVAEQMGEKMRRRMPHIDVIIGPQNIYQLPELLQKARSRKGIVATGLDANFQIPAFLPDMRRGHPFKRFVTIMQGCNNFCTYCIVPYTRGREVSRQFDDILDEINHLAQHGIREVTLLGQNVNSYGLDRHPLGDKRDFADLIHAVADIQGIERIRFTTSHPKDLSPRLIDCFAQVAKLMPHIHLPVQSGSDRVLARMNRKYTISDYLAKVARLRRSCPHIALSTDIIVGFPGEDEEDFAATMALVETVRYHSAFSFKYSDRPYAPSTRFADKVPEEVKSARLEQLQNRLQEITLERHQEYIGARMTVRVEGESRSADGQYSGRAPNNLIINFTGRADTRLQPGSLVDVVVTEACAHSLRGEWAAS